MRTKSKNEKLFNEQAKKYDIYAFEATQFDNDPDLQKAFNSFVKCKDFNLEDFDPCYLDYFQESAGAEKLFNPEIHTKAEEVESAQKLFELISPIKEIACTEYYETETQGFVEVQTANGPMEDATIYDLVARWHKFRREVDKVKPFIRETFPRWVHATKEEKKQYKEDIKNMIKNFETLGNDTKQLKRVDHFLDKYSSLNKLKRFKADILLSLQLPRIDSIKIAKKIVDLSKL